MTSGRPARATPPPAGQRPKYAPVGAGRPGLDRPTTRRAPATAARRRRWVVPTVVAVLLLLVGGLYLGFRSSDTPSPAAGQGAYQVGAPGIGATAPNFSLTATSGQTVNLSAYRGKTVLLYFHEGLGCQPCWDQIRDLTSNLAALKAAGADELVTITSGPRDLIAQKMSDDKLTATALADTDLAVSRHYQTNQFGMMGTDRDGHSFILVGPDGRIQWRADYGGAPKYTMFVPVDRLLADLKAGRRTS